MGGFYDKLTPAFFRLFILPDDGTRFDAPSDAITTLPALFYSILFFLDASDL